LDENDYKSESSEEEFVGDVQDEDGHGFVLPEPARHNIPAHEREPALFMDHLLSISDFFSTEPILSHPWFPLVMSRARFQEINKDFHVSNEDCLPQ